MKSTQTKKISVRVISNAVCVDCHCMDRLCLSTGQPDMGDPAFCVQAHLRTGAASLTINRQAQNSSRLKPAKRRLRGRFSVLQF